MALNSRRSGIAFTSGARLPPPASIVKGKSSVGLRAQNRSIVSTVGFDWIKNQMECLFGFVGNGFVVVVADTGANQSIVVQKTTEDKITCLDSHKLLGCIGEIGDRIQFSNFIQKNLNLYKFRNGIPLTTLGAASFTRCELATALRKAPYQVNMLVAGFDQRTGPALYYLDYIATLQKLEKGALGFGAYFILSLLDKYYEKNMSVEQAMELVDRCIWEIGIRMVASPASYIVKIVDKDGARMLERRSRPVADISDAME